MQRLKSGFAFFRQAWQAARRQPALLAPSLWIIGAGTALTLLALVPLGLMLSADTPGPLLSGLAGFVLAAALLLALALAYVFSAATSRRFLIATAAPEDTLTLPAHPAETGAETPAPPPGNAADLFVFALASPLAGRLGLPAEWKRAPYLVLPVLANTRLPLKAGLERANEMVRANLLRIGEELIGARALAWTGGFVIAILGILIGALAGTLLSAAAPLAGALLGVGIAGLFISASIAFCYFVTTTYHTCLYQWAIELERSRYQAQKGPVLAPPMLAAALGATAG